MPIWICHLHIHNAMLAHIKDKENTLLNVKTGPLRSALSACVRSSQVRCTPTLSPLSGERADSRLIVFACFTNQDPASNFRARLSGAHVQRSEYGAQGLLNKRPEDRLGWPHLLEHPFVQETAAEVTRRSAALADAQKTAADSRAWKGEDGAVAGADPPFGVQGINT